MQTFLPYPNFVASAMVLDRQRLGKQRVEAMQLVNAIEKQKGTTSKVAWANHPAALMWTHHIVALQFYHDCIVREWIRRGYNNNMTLYCPAGTHYPWFQPAWLGDEAVHSSHRSALLFKDPEWYGQFGWTEEPKYDYTWPKDEPLC